MVGLLNDRCIRVYSEMNEWMDCIFIVSAKMRKELKRFCRKHGTVTGKMEMAGATEIIYRIR